MPSETSDLFWRTMLEAWALISIVGPHRVAVVCCWRSNWVDQRIKAPGCELVDHKCPQQPCPGHASNSAESLTMPLIRRGRPSLRRLARRLAWFVIFAAEYWQSLPSSSRVHGLASSARCRLMAAASTLGTRFCDDGCQESPGHGLRSHSGCCLRLSRLT